MRSAIYFSQLALIVFFTIDVFADNKCQFALGSDTRATKNQTLLEFTGAWQSGRIVVKIKGHDESLLPEVFFSNRRLAAQFALVKIANINGLLFECISILESPAVENMPILEKIALLKTKIPHDVIGSIVKGTIIPIDFTLEKTIEFLGRVSRFARADKGELSENLGAIERYIRSDSGTIRVTLFTEFSRIEN